MNTIITTVFIKRYVYYLEKGNDILRKNLLTEYYRNITQNPKRISIVNSLGFNLKDLEDEST